MTLRQPAPEETGFIKTLNNMGYMTSSLDPFSQRWIDRAVSSQQPSLEIGAAYGVATVEAITKGAAVTANDIDQRHLEILKEKVPSELQNRLQLAPGRFPSDLSFPDNSFGSLLACRVLHFLEPADLEKGFEKVSRWLTPGGQAFIVTETPFLKNFAQFIPVYESRKKKGDPYPGFIADVLQWAPERGLSLPPSIHFLDEETLKRLCHNNGLKVIECEMFARTDFPKDLQLDGRESVGLICEKPL